MTPMVSVDGEAIVYGTAWVGNNPVDVTRSVKVYGMNLSRDGECGGR